jgi:YD repeat-containing protein
MSPYAIMRSLNTYGGQSELLTTTLPEGNSIRYTYDASLNPLTITKTPKPGSPLSPLVQSFSYVQFL